MAKTRKKKKREVFWPCGGKSRRGCGTECWGHVCQVKEYRKRKRAVFCLQCAGSLKK